MEKKQSSQMYVVSAFRSRACSTCVINAVLVVTVCGAFMAGVICGRMFTVAPTRPGKGSLCEDRESIDLGNVAHTGKMEENAATESSAGKGGSFVTKESLAFQLQNWTDALTVSMKRTMQKELQSLERRLRKRPVERCPKESAKIKEAQTSALARRILADLEKTVKKLVAKNLQEMISVGRDPPRSPTGQTPPTSTPTPTGSEKAKKNREGEGESLASAAPGCPIGWSLFHGSCYKFHSAHAFQWNIARQACRVERADLVKISSPEENQFVYSLARTQAPHRKYLWLGLLRGSWGEEFYWVDKSPLTYARWAHRQPKHHVDGDNCAHMYIGKGNRAMQWNDVDCVYPSIGSMAYMCERKAAAPARLAVDGLIWVESEGSADDYESGSGDEHAMSV